MFVSQSAMSLEVSIVASEYFCGSCCFDYEAAGLDAPAAAAAAADVSSSCCRAFLKRSISPLEK